MARKITNKEVQIHNECLVCGLNSVSSDVLLIKFKDFKKSGIKRVKDKTTGKYFNSMHLKFNECHCNEDLL